MHDSSNVQSNRKVAWHASASLFHSSAASSFGSSSGSGAGQPTLLHAPNLIFHSCLYFAHHSSSHLASVSPHTMILYRSYSSLVHPGTFSLSLLARSPFVTGARLLMFSLAKQTAGANAIIRTAKRMAK